MKRVRILVADADPTCESLYTQGLQPLGRVDLTVAASAAAAKERLSEQSIDLLVAAIEPSQADGLNLLKTARRADPQLPIILVVDEPTVEAATAGMRLGADDLLARNRMADEL